MDTSSYARTQFSRDFFDNGHAEWGENGKSVTEIIQLVKDYNSKVPRVRQFDVPTHNKARWCREIIKRDPPIIFAGIPFDESFFGLFPAAIKASSKSVLEIIKNYNLQQHPSKQYEIPNDRKFLYRGERYLKSLNYYY